MLPHISIVHYLSLVSRISLFFSWLSKISSFVISSLLHNCLLAISGLHITNFLGFPLSENALFPSSFLKVNFTEYRILSLTVLFFYHLRNVLLPSGLRDFLWETHCHLNCFSPIQIRFHFCLAAFKICVCFSVFRSLVMIYLSMNFFEFIWFGIH